MAASSCFGPPQPESRSRSPATIGRSRCRRGFQPTSSDRTSSIAADDQLERAGELGLRAKVTEPLVPLSGTEIGREIVFEAPDDRVVDETPGGAGAPRCLIKQQLRTTVIRFVEAVGAIQRYRNG